ncbi:MAG: hypothetical protein AB1609_10105 [Bacillota bacterium]
MTAIATHILHELVVKGQSVFVSGQVYAREGGGILSLWWLTPECGHPEARRAAHELIEQLKPNGYPMDLRILPPSSGDELPPDARPVQWLGEITDNEIDQAIEEHRAILDELAKL